VAGPALEQREGVEAWQGDRGTAVASAHAIFMVMRG
jgi:hypothetical protein